MKLSTFQRKHSLTHTLSSKPTTNSSHSNHSLINGDNPSSILISDAQYQYLTAAQEITQRNNHSIRLSSAVSTKNTFSKKASASYEFDQLKEVLKEEKLKGFLDTIKATSREKNQRVVEFKEN